MLYKYFKPRKRGGNARVKLNGEKVQGDLGWFPAKLPDEARGKWILIKSVSYVWLRQGKEWRGMLAYAAVNRLLWERHHAHKGLSVSERQHLFGRFA